MIVLLALFIYFISVLINRHLLHAIEEQNKLVYILLLIPGIGTAFIILGIIFTIPVILVMMILIETEELIAKKPKDIWKWYFKRTDHEPFL